jgi:hypothetical protein
MREIVFPQKQKVLDTDIIEFPASVGGKLVTCRITVEEMLREFQRGTNPATFEEHFLALRPQIEERARRLIQAKWKDE